MLIQLYAWWLYVTEFWKTDQIVTLGLFHFIGPANDYTCTLYIHSIITGLGWLVCFSRVSFANRINSWLRLWDSWRVLHGRHGCEIHPRDRETSIYTIQTCLGLWLAILGPIASPSSPNGGFGQSYSSYMSYEATKLQVLIIRYLSKGCIWNNFIMNDAWSIQKVRIVIMHSYNLFNTSAGLLEQRAAGEIFLPTIGQFTVKHTLCIFNYIFNRDC